MKNQVTVEVNVSFLTEGMILTGDGYDENGNKVIDKDAPINKYLINQLKAKGIKSITYQRERTSKRDEIENPMIQGENVEKAMDIITDIIGNVRNNRGSIPKKEIDSLISDLMVDIHENTDNIVSLLKLVNFDDYLYSHSVNVSTLALLLGYSLKLSEDMIHFVGFSGFLFDIGKVKLPSELLNKQTELTPEEWELVKKHPLFGYNILKEKDILNKTILEGVLLHHEKYHGGGYPFSCSYEKTSIIGQIISVCDAFDAMISNRAYKKPIPIDQAFTTIMESSGVKFNPKVSQVFLRDMVKRLMGDSLYPLDSYVILNTGEIAKIADYRQSKYTLRPIINIFFNPKKNEKFLKFVQQIDLEGDYSRYIIKKVINPVYVDKFDQHFEEHLPQYM